MSVCAQTEEESGSEEMGAPSRDAYEQKAVSKVVRVLTVMAYLLSVSLAAILLSVYYVCVWKSPELPPLNDTIEVAARRAPRELYYQYFDTAGGSNTTVSENITQQVLANITDDGFWSANETDFDVTSDADQVNVTAHSSFNASDADGTGVLNITGNVT